MYKLASKINWIYLVPQSPMQLDPLRARDETLTH